MIQMKFIDVNETYILCYVSISVWWTTFDKNDKSLNHATQLFVALDRYELKFYADDNFQCGQPSTKFYRNPFSRFKWNTRMNWRTDTLYYLIYSLRAMNV